MVCRKVFADLHSFHSISKKIAKFMYDQHKQFMKFSCIAHESLGNPKESMFSEISYQEEKRSGYIDR